jgi:hypothetical protein
MMRRTPTCATSSLRGGKDGAKALSFIFLEVEVCLMQYVTSDGARTPSCFPFGLNGAQDPATWIRG